LLFYFIFKARERNIKLWDKGTSVNELIESFTVGKDRELDLHLAKYDVLCSMSHAKILQSINLLSASELTELQNELIAIYQVIENGNFQIEEGAEDVHSQVELMLTRKLGDVGKKITAVVRATARFCSI